MRQPTGKWIEIAGTNIHYWDWPCDQDTNLPVLVLAHATGFHGRVFDALIDGFPQNRAISLDLRGHGRSDGEPIENWATIADDITVLLRALEITSAVGIGHSMGAHALVQSAHDEPAALAKLVLFDPTIFAPEFYAQAGPLFTPDNPHPAIKRKRHFASAKAMMERFSDREPYSLFDRRVFADYCTYGVTPTTDGDGMELSCSPEFEAGIYASSRSNAGIIDAARALQQPALIIRAKQIGPGNFMSSPTWPQLASIMPNATDMHRPDRTHFHPLEDPVDAARIIAEVIAA